MPRSLQPLSEAVRLPVFISSSALFDGIAHCAVADEDAPALLATMESGRVFVLKSADANPPVIAECPRCADEITEIVQSVKADAFH